MRKRKMNKLQSLYENILLPLNDVLFKINNQGIRLDIDYLQEMTKWYESVLVDLRVKMFKEVGKEFNPNSTAQIGKILFDQLGLPHVLSTAGKIHPKIKDLLNYCNSTDELKLGLSKLKTTRFKDAIPSVDKYVRSFMKHTTDNFFVKLYDEYKTLNHLYSFYMKDYHTKNGIFINGNWCVFPSYRSVASSGRLRCSSPNVQQYPNPKKMMKKRPFKIRSMLIPEYKGWKLLSIDWSQFEFRGGAYISNDQNMIKAILGDPHKLYSSKIYNISGSEVTKVQRFTGKTLNFTFLFLAWAPTAHKTLLRDYNLFFTIKECERFRQIFTEELYPDYFRYGQRVFYSAESNRYVDTLYGRRRWFKNDYKGNLQAEALNHIVQGSTTGDMSNEKIILIDKELIEGKYKGKVLWFSLLHDGFYFQVQEDIIADFKNDVIKLLESPPRFIDVNWSIPCEAEIGNNMGDV